MMMVQRSRSILLAGAVAIATCVPVFVGWTSIGDGCTLDDRLQCDLCEHHDALCVPSKCPKDCKSDTRQTANEIDTAILATCWGIALILVVVYVCTMTTTLIFGTAPSAGMDTAGTVHIHLTGPDAQVNGDRIIQQVHRRRAAVMRGQMR